MPPASPAAPNAAAVRPADPDAVIGVWDQVSGHIAASFPKVLVMADARTEVLAFPAFPAAHWQKISSANPLERVN